MSFVFHISLSFSLRLLRLRFARSSVTKEGRCDNNVMSSDILSSLICLALKACVGLKGLFKL